MRTFSNSWIGIGIVLVLMISGCGKSRHATPVVGSNSIILPPKARYIVRGSETLDRSTGLIWQRCSIGQQWDGKNGCIGLVSQFTFVQAQHLADKTWRLPSSDELQKLIEYPMENDSVRGIVNVNAFPGMDAGKICYWSSTQYGASIAWIVCLEGGSVYVGNATFGNVSDTYSVRLVRNSVPSISGK